MVLEGWVVLNFFSGLLLVLLLIFQNSTSSIKTGRRYSALLIMTLVLLGAETIGRFGETHPDHFLFLARAGYFLIFLLDPIDILFALTYIDCWMDDGRAKSRGIFAAAFKIFAVANAAMVTISALFGSGLFYYFEDGIYHRGQLFMVRAVLMMIFIMLLVVYTLLYRQNVLTLYRKSIIFLPVISLLGAVLQIFFANMDMTYAGITIGCLILFFYLQSKDVNVDYLTGVLNRRGLDVKLEERIRQSLSTGGKFSAIMMDVDHFKEINDHYGHSAGDKTVRDIAQILVDIFGQEASIGRFGGDEFCIVSELNDAAVIEQRIDKVHTAIAEIRQRNGWDEKIDVSCGYRIYDPNDAFSAEVFQEMIDELMYREKQLHHLNDRRKSETDTIRE